MENTGRYHKLPWGGGQITFPKDLAKKMGIKNREKVLLYYDLQEEVLTIAKKNPRNKMIHFIKKIGV